MSLSFDQDIMRFFCVLNADRGRRKATIKWVEEMHQKHQSLNTSKLVLVSKSGFSKEAYVKAQYYGHDAMSVQDAASVDWLSVADVVQVLGIRASILPKIRKVLLDIPEPDMDRVKAITDFLELDVEEPGKKSTNLRRYVESQLHSSTFMDKVEAVVPVNKPTILRGTISLSEGTKVIAKKVGNFPLRSLYVEAEFRRIEKTLPIKRYAYGTNVKVALARGEVNDFPVAMSVSQEQGKKVEVRVRFQSAVGNQRIELANGRFVIDS